MSSGKQTSFQYGEVSPRNHYRSNDAEYSNALHTLHNMTVMRQGGVSRRPGTGLFVLPTAQEGAATFSEGKQVYKVFSFPSMYFGERNMKKIVMHNKTGDVVTIDIYAEYSHTPSLTSTDYECPAGKGLADVKVVFADDKIYIHGLVDPSSSAVELVVINYLRDSVKTPSMEIITFNSPAFPPSGSPSSAGGYIPTAITSALAVQYLVTMELADGREIPVKHLTSINYNNSGFITTLPPVSPELIMAGDGVIAGMQFGIAVSGAIAAISKSINIYRAPLNAGITNRGAFALIARLPNGPFASTPVPTPPVTEYAQSGITDTGASDPSISPPIDNSMFTGSDLTVRDPICSCVYQTRHILAVGGDNDSEERGSILVSKIGCTSQFAQPAVYRNSEAFSMSLPVTDGSPVRQLIAGERLVAFSDLGTYVIAGGESGILTPTAINPIKIATEGASKAVVPLIVGTNIVYMNSKHTKLMMVVFSSEGRGAAVEIGKLADHLINGESFVEMERLPGADDIVLLLKDSGDIVSVNISDGGAAGFSAFDMAGGRVESMAQVGKVGDTSLLMSVVRSSGMLGGIRSWELIEDNSTQSSANPQQYLDSAILRGSRIVSEGHFGYQKREYGYSSFSETVSIAPITEYINISAADYSVGKDLSVSVILDDFRTSDTLLVGSRLRVSFDNDRFVYLTVKVVGTTDGVTPYTMIADIDIPEYLQDVDSQALSAKDKNLRKSNWVQVFSKISSYAGDLQGLRSLYTLLQDGSSVGSMPNGEVEVAVVGDGKIYSSPLNPAMATLNLVKDATGVYLDLPEPAAFVQVGIPYESYMQTLPIEAGGERTLTDDKKIVDKVGIALYNTVGGYVGLPGVGLEAMTPIKTRDDLNAGNPDLGFSGYLNPIMPSNWTKSGMVRLMQVDPAPMTVLSVYPKGLAGD